MESKQKNPVIILSEEFVDYMKKYPYGELKLSVILEDGEELDISDCIISENN